MGHKCGHLIITCMDFRIQESISDYAVARGIRGDYDLIAVAGAQKALVDPATRDGLLDHVGISVELHEVQSVLLIAHEDCGAYGGVSAFPDRDAELAAYGRDLAAAEAAIGKRWPRVIVEQLLARPTGDGGWLIEPF